MFPLFLQFENLLYLYFRFEMSARRRKRKWKLDTKLIDELTRSDSSDDEPKQKSPGLSNSNSSHGRESGECSCANPLIIDTDHVEDHELVEADTMFSSSILTVVDDNESEDVHSDVELAANVPNVEPGTSDVRGIRWRRKDKENWKAEIRKRQCKRGEEHVDSTGKIAPRKEPRSVTSHECRQKCCEKVTEEERERLCRRYWDLEDYKRKKDFILANVTSFSPKQRRTFSVTQRNTSRAYFFTINDQKLRVCRDFFLATLNISNNSVISAFSGRSENNTFTGCDRRGCHPPSHKMSAEMHLIIKEHIESFPVMESHYCRTDTNKKYLEPGLNIVKMYELYKKKCEDLGVDPVHMQTYRVIFCTEFNLGFFHPRKDQCLQCENFRNLGETEKLNHQEEYGKHLKRKVDAQQRKRSDKEEATRDSSFVTATFDLQSVLQLPSSDVSTMYYKRKICVYNFTIYEANSGMGHCYIWTELDGKRGSSEIGSCLIHYLDSLPSHVRRVSFHADSCGGQNRNQYVAAALMHHVQTSTIDEITLNFLETGHTQMECDSMHSAIENAKKNVKVYTIGEWCNVITLARRSKPYTIHRMNYSSFYDLNKLNNELITNRNKNTIGETVNWMKIHSLRFFKEEPYSFFYLYEPSYEEYGQVNTKLKRGRRTKHTLVKLYQRQLGISAAKKTDLTQLCQNGSIPEEVQHWYLNLPVHKINGE